MSRSTPDDLRNLPDGEIFVFGSNAGGQHGGGAARVAARDFGAEWGVGEGMSGQSYALPTMEGRAAFEQAAARFVTYAEQHPELTFVLTKVGCGIAGYTEGDVKQWFADAPSNVVKPPGW